MHDSFDKSSDSDGRIHRSWGAGLYALPILLAIGLIGMAMTHPAVSGWISQAAQAEFAGTDPAPDVPTQLARPSTEIRTVKAF